MKHPLDAFPELHAPFHVTGETAQDRLEALRAGQPFFRAAQEAAPPRQWSRRRFVGFVGCACGAFWLFVIGLLIGERYGTAIWLLGLVSALIAAILAVTPRPEGDTPPRH